MDIFERNGSDWIFERKAREKKLNATITMRTKQTFWFANKSSAFNETERNSFAKHELLAAYTYNLSLRFIRQQVNMNRNKSDKKYERSVYLFRTKEKTTSRHTNFWTSLINENVGFRFFFFLNTCEVSKQCTWLAWYEIHCIVCVSLCLALMSRNNKINGTFKRISKQVDEIGEVKKTEKRWEVKKNV